MLLLCAALSMGMLSGCESGKSKADAALQELKEYLEDYASPATKALGEKLVQAELPNIPQEKVREVCVERLQKIAQGERDFRF